MRKVFTTLAAILVMTPLADATLTIFFSNGVTQSGGLTVPANALSPTLCNQTDVTSGGYVLAGPTPAPSVATINPNGADGIANTADDEWGYIWLQFDSAEPINRLIHGAHLLANPAPSIPSIAYYVVDDTAGTIGNKRWDGAYTPPLAPEFRHTNQILVTVSWAGIENRADSSMDWNLYDHTTHTALLGAARFDPAGGPYSAIMSLGPLGIQGPAAGRSDVQFLPANIVPEPASVLSLTLIALLRRRTAAA